MLSEQLNASGPSARAIAEHWGVGRSYIYRLRRTKGLPAVFADLAAADAWRALHAPSPRWGNSKKIATQGTTTTNLEKLARVARAARSMTEEQAGAGRTVIAAARLLGDGAALQQVLGILRENPSLSLCGALAAALIAAEEKLKAVREAAR